MNDEPTRDEILRVWSLENAVSSTNRNTKPSLVIKRAEKYYGFLTRNECQVQPLKKKETK